MSHLINYHMLDLIKYILKPMNKILTDAEINWNKWWFEHTWKLCIKLLHSISWNSKYFTFSPTRPCLLHFPSPSDLIWFLSTNSSLLINENFRIYSRNPNQNFSTVTLKYPCLRFNATNPTIPTTKIGIKVLNIQIIYSEIVIFYFARNYVHILNTHENVFTFLKIVKWPDCTMQ